MSKFYQFTKNGGIEYRDESVPENGHYPQGSDRFNEILASGVEILPYVKTPADAWAEGSEWVSKHFTDGEQKMLLGLATMGNDTQKQKAQAVFAWITQLQTVALSAPATFVASDYPPPYSSYFEVLENIP